MVESTPFLPLGLLEFVNRVVLLHKLDHLKLFVEGSAGAGVKCRPPLRGWLPKSTDTKEIWA